MAIKWSSLPTSYLCTALACFAACWVFFDFISLPQFVQLPHEEAKYQLAMADIPVLFVHEHTFVIGIESLTPNHTWMKMLEDVTHKVLVYVEDQGCMRPCPMNCLVLNRNAYQQRGWCKVEREWSSLKGVSASNLRLTYELEEGRLGTKVPLSPKSFRTSMSSAVFTHLGL